MMMKKSCLVVFFLFVGFQQASGFIVKTACLLEYRPSEDFLEGEYKGWASHYYGIRGPRNGHAWAQPLTGQQSFPTGQYGLQGEGAPTVGSQFMDDEDWREMMGYGENENEGQNHEHSQGQGHGGRYMDADGEWEDARRRKRAVVATRHLGGHTPDTLKGHIKCPASDTVHIINITLGYSDTSYCLQARYGCQAGSDKATQILHCQGANGQCDVTVQRPFLSRCGARVNFAKILYECVPAARHEDICTKRSSDESGPIALSSPSYPSPGPAAGTDQFVTCECTLMAVDGSVFELEYFRSQLPGKAGACDGDLVLLETPIPGGNGRYTLQAELCGTNVTSGLTIPDSILRVTFLGGSPQTGVPSGFLAKLQAKAPNGTLALYHVSCEGGPPGQAALAPTAPATTSVKPISGNVYANRLLSWMKANGRSLPAGFNPANLPPNFFNMSREELRTKMAQRVQAQRLVNTGSDGGNSGSDLPVSNTDKTQPSQFASVDDAGAFSSPGVLSGVVASLASVILIMASIGAYFFYRRYQKRTKESDYNGSQRSPYGGSTWYEENGVYNDGNDISEPPSTITCPSVRAPAPPTEGKRSRLTTAIYNVAQRVPLWNTRVRNSGHSIEIHDPPVSPDSNVYDTPVETLPDQHAPPVAPPRVKRDKTRRRANVQHDISEEGSPYDNANDNREPATSDPTPSESEAATGSETSDSDIDISEDLASQPIKIREPSKIQIKGSEDDETYSTINEIQNALHNLDASDNV